MRKAELSVVGLLLLPAFVCFAGPERFHFAIIGDRTGTPDQAVFAQTIGEMARFHPDFAVNVGDLVEGGNPNVEEEWDLVLDTLALLGCPVFFVPGNNDIWNEESREIYARRTGRPPHYSFDYGSVHFVVLNNSTLSSWQQAEDQLAWLEEDLARHQDAALTFCFFHKPFWYDAVGKEDRLHQVLKENGVDFVINGHYHQFTRTNWDGIEYIVIGSSGGAKGVNEAAGQFYGYGLVTVDGSSADVAMVRTGLVVPQNALQLAEVNAASEVENRYVDLEPVAVDDTSKSIKTKVRLEVENITDETFTETVSWTNGNPAWKIRPMAKAVEFPARSQTAVVFDLENKDTGSLYPLPKISLTYPTEGWGACRIEGLLPVKRSYKVRKVRTPPEIDGTLGEPCWNPNNRLGPLQGHGATPLKIEPTQVYLVRDASNLYLGVRCREIDVGSLKAAAGERDSAAIFSDDWVMLFLEPSGENRTAYQFVINPEGQVLDRTLTFGDGPLQRDPAWNGPQVLRTGKEDGAWTLEMAIPFNALKVPDPAPKRWGFNIGRMQSRRNEMGTWQPYLSFDPKTYGELRMR